MWSRTFTKKIAKLGFKTFESQACVFNRRKPFTIIVIYVDDGIIIAQDKNIVDDIIKSLSDMLLNSNTTSLSTESSSSSFLFNSRTTSIVSSLPSFKNLWCWIWIMLTSVSTNLTFRLSIILDRPVEVLLSGVIHDKVVLTSKTTGGHFPICWLSIAMILLFILNIWMILTGSEFFHMNFHVTRFWTFFFLVCLLHSSIFATIALSWLLHFHIPLR